MMEIFDANKIHGRPFYVRRMIALDSRLNVGEAIERVKRDMAMQLATQLFEGEPFFLGKSFEANSTATLEYTADVIVMTKEEYLQLRHETFREGVRHAQGFMPVVFEIDKARKA